MMSRSKTFDVAEQMCLSYPYQLGYVDPMESVNAILRKDFDVTTFTFLDTMLFVYNNSPRLKNKRF